MDSTFYTVVIGDVQGSKRLNNEFRYQTQLFIKSSIIQINEEFQDQIEAPFTITKGDEFQGLLPNLQSAFDVIRALERITFPVQLRFGIGVGEVLKMGGKLPIEMDGPAFHRANAALTQAKRKKCWSCIATPDEHVDLIVNTVLFLIQGIRSKWSERHYRLYWNYLDLGTYREVAERERVTPQAIGDILKNCRAIEVKNAEENLKKYFQHLDYQWFPRHQDSSVNEVAER